MDWARAGRALIRRKWLIALVTLLAALAGVAATRLVPPQYEASTTIWIDQGNRNSNRAGMTGGQLFGAQGWAELATSGIVVDSVVLQQHLWVHTTTGNDSLLFAGILPGQTVRPGRYQLTLDSLGKHYRLVAQKIGMVESGTVGDSIGRSIGLRWLPPVALLPAGSTIDVMVAAPQAVAISLSSQLTPSIDQAGNFLSITLTGTDPSGTATALNAVASQYVKVASRLQRERLLEVTKALSEQVQYASQAMASAEQQLQTFRVNTITLPQDQVAGGSAGGPAASDLSPDAQAITQFHATQARLDSIRGEHAALMDLLGDTGVSVAAFQAVPSVQRSPGLMTALNELTEARDSLRRLRRKYTDSYLPVVHVREQIAGLQDTTIPRLTQGLMARLAVSQRSLTAQVTQMADSLRQLPVRATQQARLMRQVALATSLYDNLQQQYGQAQIAMSSNLADVHVLDPAVVPPWPTKDTTIRIIAFAIVAGLGVATVGAVLLDRWDPRFRYPSQVTGDMGLPILATIPHIKAIRRSPEAADNDVTLREAFRGLRMNVSYAYGAAGPVAITVVSPGSHDGKSFVSLNLARSFAETGARVVLIDGDVRRGVQHRRCQTLRKPGITDYLRGGVPLDVALKPTRFNNLHLVSSGTRLHEAPELLGSSGMVKLMADLRERFDVIICDSTPLSAGIDAFALGAATGNMLLVLRTGVSDREMTFAKLDLVRRMPVRLLGAVLNDVPNTAPYAYYSHYLPGYDTETEPRTPAAGLLTTETH